MGKIHELFKKFFTTSTPETMMENRTKQYDSTPIPKKCNKCIYNNACSSSPSSDCIYAFEENHFPVKNGFH